MPYVATINVPGYLPMDDDPPVFDTAQEAWSYLADERKRAEDDFADWNGGEYSETKTDLDAIAKEYRADATDVWLTTFGVNRDGTGTVYGDTPGYDGTHDLGLAYCVTLSED